LMDCRTSSMNNVSMSFTTNFGIILFNCTCIGKCGILYGWPQMPKHPNSHQEGNRPVGCPEVSLPGLPLPSGLRPLAHPDCPIGGHCLEYYYIFINNNWKYKKNLQIIWCSNFLASEY
jgi:hypothetical protein